MNRAAFLPEVGWLLLSLAGLLGRADGGSGQDAFLRHPPIPLGLLVAEGGIRARLFDRRDNLVVRDLRIGKERVADDRFDGDLFFSIRKSFQTWFYVSPFEFPCNLFCKIGRCTASNYCEIISNHLSYTIKDIFLNLRIFSTSVISSHAVTTGTTVTVTDFVSEIFCKAFVISTTAKPGVN